MYRVHSLQTSAVASTACTASACARCVRACVRARVCVWSPGMFACCGPALALRLAKRFDRSCASILSSPRVWVGHLSIPLCALHCVQPKEPNRSKSQRASPIIKRVRKVSPASNTPTHAVHSAKLQTPCGPRGLVLVVRARAVVRSPAQTLERRGRTGQWEGVGRFRGGKGVMA